MYYEEKIIDGALYWRGLPDGRWCPFTREKLFTRFLETKTENERLRAGIEYLESTALSAIGYVEGANYPERATEARNRVSDAARELLDGRFGENT